MGLELMEGGIKNVSGTVKYPALLRIVQALRMSATTEANETQTASGI